MVMVESRDVGVGQFCSGANSSAMLASAAKALGLEHHALNTLRGERKRGAWHVQNVNAHHSRLKGWIARFNGVATSYLPNYLGWFRALERNAQTGGGALSLLKLSLSRRKPLAKAARGS